MESDLNNEKHIENLSIEIKNLMDSLTAFTSAKTKTISNMLIKIKELDNRIKNDIKIINEICDDLSNNEKLIKITKNDGQITTSSIYHGGDSFTLEL